MGDSEDALLSRAPQLSRTSAHRGAIEIHSNGAGVSRLPLFTYWIDCPCDPGPVLWSAGRDYIAVRFFSPTFALAVDRGPRGFSFPPGERSRGRGGPRPPHPESPERRRRVRRGGSRDRNRRRSAGSHSLTVVRASLRAP